MIKKLVLSVLVIALVFTGCENEQNPYLITKDSIGQLTDSTAIKELDVIFKNDSIARYDVTNEFIGNNEDMEIFEKGGNHLLTITPFRALDSTSTVKTIEIKDSRFTTVKGVSISSTFKDIQTNYKISSVQNTINNIIVVVKEINAHFVISKEELPSNMRYDMTLKIDPIQIPDNAKIKTVYLHWY